MIVIHMSKYNSQKTKMDSLYQKKDGHVFIKFVKPIRLVKKMLYKERSIIFQTPL